MLGIVDVGVAFVVVVSAVGVVAATRVATANAPNAKLMHLQPCLGILDDGRVGEVVRGDEDDVAGVGHQTLLEHG